MQLGEYKYFLGCDSFPFLLNKHCIASQPVTSFTVFGAVHFLMRIIFVTSVTKQRRQFEYHQFSHC